MNEPKCRHKRAGTVSVPYVQGEAHASTAVCARPDCIEDAKLWVNRITLTRNAEYIADKS